MIKNIVQSRAAARKSETSMSTGSTQRAIGLPEGPSTDGVCHQKQHDPVRGETTLEVPILLCREEVHSVEGQRVQLRAAARETEAEKDARLHEEQLARLNASPEVDRPWAVATMSMSPQAAVCLLSIVCEPCLVNGLPPCARTTLQGTILRWQPTCPRCGLWRLPVACSCHTVAGLIVPGGGVLQQQMNCRAELAESFCCSVN